MFRFSRSFKTNNQLFKVMNWWIYYHLYLLFFILLYMINLDNFIWLLHYVFYSSASILPLNTYIGMLIQQLYTLVLEFGLNINYSFLLPSLKLCIWCQLRCWIYFKLKCFIKATVIYKGTHNRVSSIHFQLQSHHTSGNFPLSMYPGSSPYPRSPL